MDYGPADPVVRKRRLAQKPERDRGLLGPTDLIGPGGLGPGAPQRLLNWKLDWKAYFHKFCEAHGGNPIELGGRLVLPDGWAYSCTSYKGPEWPPPADPQERRALLASYWAERAGIVKDELKLLRLTRKGLIEMMAARDVSLVKVTRRFERVEGVSSLRVDREELTLLNIDERIKWLDADLAESEVKALEYGGGK